MLMAHQIRPDWTTGQVQILRTVFLSDPDGVVPFRIATEFTDKRYLTGADFDIEAIQPIGDLLYFGDEFGPFVLATNLDGEVVFVRETFLGPRKLVSPDHPAQRLPALPNRAIAFDVRRSRGHEGMARSPDGSRLYPLIEGPIWDPETGDLEKTQDGRAVLRMLEFLVAQRTWTPNSWTYVLEDPRHAIGDFNMISESHGLVIERDGGQGVPDAACADGQDPIDCFVRPAVFKRVYLIEIGAPGTVARKLAYVDLMDIQDPDGVARLGGRDGRFTFPMVTIESVDWVDAQHIIVGNDNNLPFSSGRALGQPDHNEWILLHVPDLLNKAP